MKFKLTLLLLLAVFLNSCNKKSELETSFKCQNSNTIIKLKEIKDVKKNFKIKVPENWKTKLYFDEYQSAVFTADTTKQLSETYILDTTWKSGELILDESLEEKIKSNSDLTIIESKFENINDKPSYWHHSAGKKNNFDFNTLDVYIKTSVDSYLLISTQIYGNENINQRICESIQLINTLELI